MALVALCILAMFGVWGWVLLRPIFEANRKRAEIQAIEADLARAWKPPQ